jgi:hypothetical protein
MDVSTVNHSFKENCNYSFQVQESEGNGKDLSTEPAALKTNGRRRTPEIGSWRKRVLS